MSIGIGIGLSPSITSSKGVSAPPGYALLRGADGAYLKGADGAYLYGKAS